MWCCSFAWFLDVSDMTFASRGRLRTKITSLSYGFNIVRQPSSFPCVHMGHLCKSGHSRDCEWQIDAEFKWCVVIVSFHKTNPFWQAACGENISNLVVSFGFPFYSWINNSAFPGPWSFVEIFDAFGFTSGVFEWPRHFLGILEMPWQGPGWDDTSWLWWRLAPGIQ